MSSLFLLVELRKSKSMDSGMWLELYRLWHKKKLITVNLPLVWRRKNGFTFTRKCRRKKIKIVSNFTTIAFCLLQFLANLLACYATVVIQFVHEIMKLSFIIFFNLCNEIDIYFFLYCTIFPPLCETIHNTTGNFWTTLIWVIWLGSGDFPFLC